MSSSPIPKERRFVITLEKDCPYFAGHFPGHPILPAVAQLDMILHLIRREGHPGAVLTGADGLRFQHTIAPGAEIELVLETFSPGEPTAFRFDRNGKTLSRGILTWSEG